MIDNGDANMSHESENTNRLRISTTTVVDFEKLPVPSPHVGDVWLIVLPGYRRLDDSATSKSWFCRLKQFIESLGSDAILAILTSPEDAAVTLPQLSKLLRFQLWVAIKFRNPVCMDTGRLPEHHASLLILSRAPHVLRHTKTRIAYTFCPACDKTTKDYGGKKHTYHEFGTLMSDVWRDVAWSPGDPVTEIAGRLADLFGLEPHRELHIVSLVSDRRLAPRDRNLKNGRGRTRVDCRLEQLPSRLAHGDCLKLLKDIPDNSVDFCFADPPYNLSKRYDSCDDALDIVEYFSWCDLWLDELARVLRPGRTCAVLNIPQWAIRHLSNMRTQLRFQNWIVWEGLSLPVRMIMPAHYSIVCCSKGEPRSLPGLLARERERDDEEALAALKEFYCLRSSCIKHRKANNIEDHCSATDLWWDIHRLKHNCRRVDHPCQLPPALMRRLIAAFTFRDEMVLDPFNGAGTTTLCAEAMGRRFVGLELSELYHNIATQRHEHLRRGGDPFGKDDSIPKAKNSRVKRIGDIAYEVPKKVLQLEVRAIAKILGNLPTREDVERMSKYPIRYFDEYFLSWGEVCAAARTTGMKETRSSSRKSASRKPPMLFDC